MTTFVLVPGMWLGAWAWQDVASRLAEAGHDPRPVTLSGVAERAAEATPQTDLDTHVADVVALIEGADLRDVVLVGHSYGGMVVSVAAGVLAARLRRVVYVDSGPLPEGMSQFGTNPPEQQERILAEIGDGFLAPVPPFRPDPDDPSLAGLDADMLALLRERATPHPFASARQPVHYRPDFATVPSALISCMFPAAQVHEMIAAGHPYFALLAGADVLELPTGHWPMLSRPTDLATLLSTL
ncbi:alpha/beta hydrolase [Catellatospora citrea]|uniref:alpha/beta fold hydrolase n=1 Tax=Catellatospora citrea TaxID=53366 RepID=UPI0033CEB3D5